MQTIAIQNQLLAERMFVIFHHKLPDMNDINDVREFNAILEDVRYARENSERRTETRLRDERNIARVYKCNVDLLY